MYIIDRFKSPIAEDYCYLSVREVGKISISCIPGEKSQYCYYEAPGWGIEYCPLSNFKVPLFDNSFYVNLLKWWENSINCVEYDLKEFANVLERRFLSKITCSLCKRRIVGAFNLLHYNDNDGTIICDECFNTDPKADELLGLK
jgi:hypothetical protein